MMTALEHSRLARLSFNLNVQRPLIFDMHNADRQSRTTAAHLAQVTILDLSLHVRGVAKTPRGLEINLYQRMSR